MRFFAAQKSIVKALPLFLPMVDRSMTDIPLEFNLEIINSVLNGRLDPNQPDFQLDAYTARCMINAKKTEIQDIQKTTFLVEGDQFNEMVTESKKKGGVAEEAVSYSLSEEQEDPFSVIELEQQLTLNSLLGFQRQFERQGVSLILVLQGVQENNLKSLEVLRKLSEDNPDFRETLETALQCWSGEGLLPRMEKELNA